MGTIPRHATVDAVVDAPPTAVWEVVGDPRRTGEWSHECLDVAVRRRRHRAGRRRCASAAGTRSGRTAGRAPARSSGFEPGRQISWRTIPSRPMYNDSTIWTITVEPDGADGTRITQRYEVVKLGPVMDRFIYQFVKVHRDRRAGSPPTSPASARWPAVTDPRHDRVGSRPRFRGGSPCVVSDQHLWPRSS